MNCRYLLLLLLFMLFNNGVFAIIDSNNNSNDEESSNILQEDSCVAVVGYYCKSDTTWYDLQYKKYSYSNDTVIKADYIEEFMIVVEDSTSHGYKMRYIPLSFEGKSPKNREYNDLYMKEINHVLSKLNCVFYTNDVGEVTKIENWQQIRDTLSKHIDSFFESWFESDKGMDSILNKNVLANSIKMSLSEEGIKEICHLNQLFGFHGKEYVKGEYQDSTYSNGYPVNMYYNIGYYHDKDDTTIQYPFINIISEMKLSINDFSNNIENYLGLITKEQNPDKQQLIKSSLDSLRLMSDRLTIMNVSNFVLAENGWPLQIFNKSSSGFKDKFGQDEIYIIEEKRISWWNY